MPKYGVDIPIVGHIFVEVEADSPEEAIETAMALPWDDEKVVELYTVKTLMTGNVCHVDHDKADA